MSTMEVFVKESKIGVVASETTFAKVGYDVRFANLGTTVTFANGARRASSLRTIGILTVLASLGPLACSASERESRKNRWKMYFAE